MNSETMYKQRAENVQSPAITEPESTSPRRSKDLVHIGAQFKSCEFQHPADIDNQDPPTISTPRASESNASGNEHQAGRREGRTEEERLKACAPMEKYVREGYKDGGSVDVRVNKGQVFKKNGCSCKCNVN